MAVFKVFEAHSDLPLQKENKRSPLFLQKYAVILKMNDGKKF